MTTPSKPTPGEREQQLAAMRKRMGKLLRRGETAEYDRLSAEYGRLKGEHAQLVHEEHVAERRAARAALRAQERVERPERWRLPAGFGQSPLARQRAMQPVPEVPVVSVGRPALSPWRRSWSPMQERIWRPGR